MNKQLNKQIKTIENKITNTKSALKIWAQQISQYHKKLKALSQELETIKQQVIMNKDNIKQNENNINNESILNSKGETD